MSEFSNCPDFETLAAWIDGRVDEATRLRLMAHIADCERCAELVDGVLAVSDDEDIDSGVTEEPSPSLEPSRSPRRATVAAPPKSPRYWPAYGLAAAAVLVAVWGIPLAQWRFEEATLARNLASLSEDGATLRESNRPLSPDEIAVAKECRRFLTKSDKAPELELAIPCLELVSRDPDLASMVVETDRIRAWLAGAGPLHGPSCHLLEAAWSSLRGSIQDQLQSHREDCRNKLENSARSSTE